MNKEKIGFIGLGIMGGPMCTNLIKAGYKLVVYDHNRVKVDTAIKNGATAAFSAADVAKQCNVIITMVQNSPQVREAALGKDGIIKTARPGTVLIDMSSIDPVETRAIGEELSKHGIEMMDAPVSGGEPKAIDGTLSVMAGGKKELFDLYKPLLLCMASSVVYVGELGSGNVSKLANQMIVAVNIAVLSEALTLAKKAGADPEKVFEAIKGGLAGSTVMNAKAPMMLAHNFIPGFRVELHIKDLANALNAGQSVSSPMPLTSQVMEMMQELKSDGHDKDDHSSLSLYYEKLSGITL